MKKERNESEKKYNKISVYRHEFNEFKRKKWNEMKYNHVYPHLQIYSNDKQLSVI